MATFYFKWLYPEAEIIVFEPDHKNFEYLVKNIEYNRLTGVALKNEALSSADGQDVLYEKSDDAWRTSLTMIPGVAKSRGEDSKIAIKTCRLSFYLKEQIFDFVKLDIEGAETRVISEASAALGNAAEWVVGYHYSPNNPENDIGAIKKHFLDNSFALVSFQQAGEFPCGLYRFQKQPLKP